MGQVLLQERVGLSAGAAPVPSEVLLGSEDLLESICAHRATCTSTRNRSFSTDTTDSRPGRPSQARAEVMGVSPGSSPFSKLPDVSGCCLSNSYPETGPETSEDVFSTLLYWQTPLPDVSKDVEVFLSEPGPLEGSHGGPEAACDSCVARSKIRKVLQNLQGHVPQELLPCACATVSV